MKVAIIGASGKTGMELVRQSLDRGFETIGVCRDASVEKLDEFAGRHGLTFITAPVVSSEPILRQALAGCDAVGGADQRGTSEGDRTRNGACQSRRCQRRQTVGFYCR